MIVWELHDPGSSDEGELYSHPDKAKDVARVPWPGEPPITLTWVEQPSEVPGVSQHYGTSPDGYEYVIRPRVVEENIVNEVFAVIIEERHSGIGMIGVYTSLDAALTAADGALSEYADGYGPDDMGRWDSGRGSCGVSWGDGNKIIVERTQLHQAA